ncbi:olfactory receptor 50-like [Protobothrops mucrosquamatus]|uniref:olfactory receptor 50-like n=1 Tax=Protobothrops mucrosquamatus TaxID=103944 RepID=UPI0010FAD66E|nr:olfactory receptor 50-like [Protobothrops mucrosquamatus]
MENQTITTEFILLGLSSNPEIQLILFFVILIIYTITLLGNLLIILIIRIEHGLHTPMFFFLSHLAFVDICYSTVTVPKMLANFIANKKTISLIGCIVQIFSFIHFACVDFFLLSVMAFDRYVAICNPLHYSIIMRKQMCRQLVGGSWLIVVCMFLFSAFFRYLTPGSQSPTDLEKVISIQYTVLTPMLNPIIYSLKNKDIKKVIRKKWQNLGKMSV